MKQKLKEIECPKCGEIVGYNEEGHIAMAVMFCKNRPHRLYQKPKREEN